MTITRTGSALTGAVLVGAALALSACTSGGSASGGPGIGAPARSSTPGGTFTWAYDQQLTSYNANTADQRSTANLAVLSGVLSGFWQYRPDGGIVPNPDFGTQEKISDRPLTVRYTISDKAVWSDGAPVGCDDLMLTWLANSGLTGTGGFSSAAIDGYADMRVPQCGKDDRTLTVVYRTPFAGWETMFGPGSILPAHVLRKQARTSKSILELAAEPSSPDLARAVAFYNTGWKARPGQLREDLMPSSGPYVLDRWVAGQSITLTANPRWWGTPPRTGTVVVRYLAVPAQAQALRAGEIQAMDPPSDAAVLAQLKAAGDAITYSTHDQLTFEHLDFNLAGQFADRTLREAFAACLPRQQIVDTVIKPANPRATVLQSRFLLPFQPQYAAVAASAGGQRYAVVDLARAKQLLAGRKPTVRIAWRKDSAQANSGRLTTIGLIRASCGQAGFTVVDAGTPTFFDKEWPGGVFDVALFSWTGGPGAATNPGVYVTGGAQNHQKYGNPQVDRLFAQVLAEPDRERRTALLGQLDALLWTDLATIPLYAYPGVLATAKNVQGVEYNPGVTDLAWNVASWGVS